MRKSAFWLDPMENQDDNAFEGYTTGELWNGWATPAFAIEEAHRLLDSLKRMKVASGYYDPKSDSFVISYEGPEKYTGQYITVDTGAAIGITRIKVYPIGAYAWMWQEVPPIIPMTPPLLAWLKYALKRHDAGHNGDQRLCSPLYVWEVLKYRGWFKHVDGWLVFNERGYAEAKKLVESVKVNRPMLDLISGEKERSLRVKATDGPWADYLVESDAAWEALVRDPVMAKLFTHSLDLVRFLYQLYENGDIPVNQIYPETWLKLEAIMGQLLELPTYTKS